MTARADPGGGDNMFEELRAHYMPRFERALSDHRQELTRVVAEVMLELPRPSEPELLHRIYRVDILGQAPDGSKAIEVNVDQLSPRRASLEGFGIPVSLHPAVWNGLEFEVDGDPPPEAGLLAWIAKWIDIDDERYDEGADFQGVIHNCFRPSRSEAGYRISVDFGSAPIEAVHELIDLLAPTARAMRIGSGLGGAG
jgi:hypothetical protein